MEKRFQLIETADGNDMVENFRRERSGWWREVWKEVENRFEMAAKGPKDSRGAGRNVELRTEGGGEKHFARQQKRKIDRKASDKNSISGVKTASEHQLNSEFFAFLLNCCRWARTNSSRGIVEVKREKHLFNRLIWLKLPSSRKPLTKVIAGRWG